MDKKEEEFDYIICNILYNLYKTTAKPMIQLCFQFFYIENIDKATEEEDDNEQ